jgi:hypothetical protein
VTLLSLSTYTFFRVLVSTCRASTKDGVRVASSFASIGQLVRKLASDTFVLRDVLRRFDARGVLLRVEGYTVTGVL